MPANRSGASTVIAKLREDDWNEDWEFDCKVGRARFAFVVVVVVYSTRSRTQALLFSYIEQCKTFCMTRMDAGEKQQMLFDAIGKTITSWLSLSVSGALPMCQHRTCLFAHPTCHVHYRQDGPAGTR